MIRFPSLQRWAPWCGAALVSVAAPFVARSIAGRDLDWQLLLGALLFALGGSLLGLVFSSASVVPTIACVAATSVLVAVLTSGSPLSLFAILVAPALAFLNVLAALLGGYAGVFLRTQGPQAPLRTILCTLGAFVPAVLGATWHAGITAHAVYYPSIPVALAGACVSGLVLGLRRACPAWTLVAASALPIVSLRIVLQEIARDPDPTNNNLWPIFVAMMLVLSVFATAVSYIPAWIVQHLRHHGSPWTRPPHRP